MQSELSTLVKTLLEKRGIDAEHTPVFLAPDYERDTHDPFLLNDMYEAVDRVLRAIEKNERIAVYADFDCDGIPGASLLSDLFEKIGYKNIEIYIPHRDREGYGFHTDAITALAARGVSLIITVDVGTTAVDAVRFASEKNIDVIVTDHHEIVSELPEALALINPKLNPPAGGYPFSDLCGTGVAFKLAQALLMEGKKRSIESFTAIPDGWEKWLLDLVAIATVADMVPLVDENRTLAYFGIMVLRKSRRPGIDALCNSTRLKKGEITEDDIGFTIAPRVNAASRMDDPVLALKLLTTKDAREAEGLAAQLERLNASRKGIVGGIVREAKKRSETRFTESPVVVLGDPEWKPALLGLAANSVLAERGGIVCLWGRDANGRIKGSCRSDGSMSVVALFTSAREALEEFGGHEKSGGFSVSHDRVHELPEQFTRAAEALMLGKETTVESNTAPDFALALSDISWNVFRDIGQLRPFGIGNPKPVFLIERVSVTGVKRFGKTSDHIEVMLSANGHAMRAYEFFKAPVDFSHEPKVGAQAKLLATLDRDSFRNSLALRIVDILPA